MCVESLLYSGHDAKSSAIEPRRAFLFRELLTQSMGATCLWVNSTTVDKSRDRLPMSGRVCHPGHPSSPEGEAGLLREQRGQGPWLHLLGKWGGVQFRESSVSKDVRSGEGWGREGTNP